MRELKKAEQQKRREKSKQLAKLRAAQLAARKVLLEAKSQLAVTEDKVNTLDNLIAY